MPEIQIDTTPVPSPGITPSPTPVSGADGIGLRLNREQREYVRREVVRRTLEEQKELCRRSRDLNLEVIINDAVYQEKERLKTAPNSKENREQSRFWADVGRRFHRVEDSERESILASIVAMYVDEIMGYFNPVIHNIAAHVLPWGLKAMLSRFSPVNFLRYLGSQLNLEENLIISGPLDQIRGLSKRAALIMAPTHVSNLDSVVIGLGLFQSRLPPFTYGAGLNLFSNRVVSFFMNNLGAYKVDRRKKNGIYKSALKQYATLSMEMGHHNLFFPGGTRSRSGEVEQKIKLGLLGCGINVYAANLVSGKPNPDVFVIPCTLSCGLVLEARSLIEEHLQETGKSRYIRVRGEYSRPMRVLNFWRNLQSMDSKIHMRFGEPLDLFGNKVDADGVSRDAHGRAVDRTKYLQINGSVTQDAQRDQEYTRELGRSILAAFRSNNVALSTHIAAFAAFQQLRRLHPQFDLYRSLRTMGSDHAVAKSAILGDIARLLARLRELEREGGIIVDPQLADASAEAVFARAMDHFSSFHDGEALRDGTTGVYTENMKLLYYYRNRLDHYGLDTVLEN